MILTGKMLPRTGQPSYYHVQRSTYTIWIRLVGILASKIWASNLWFTLHAHKHFKEPENNNYQ